MFLYTLAKFAAHLGAFLYCIFRRLLACSLLLWYTEENDVGGHPTMNTDVLFDRAFAIRAAKPWQHLFDTHIFAVRFSDGEIACCSVMGRNGTHLALALYSLTDGLYALDKLMTTDMRVLPRYRAEECMLGQDCIQVSFENAQELSLIHISEPRDRG